MINDSSYLRRRDNAGHINSAVLFAVSNGNVSRHAWILDSGANVYIINNLDFVTDFKKLELNVGTADGSGNM